MSLNILNKGMMSYGSFHNFQTQDVSSKCKETSNKDQADQMPKLQALSIQIAQYRAVTASLPPTPPTNTDGGCLFVTVLDGKLILE